MLSRNGGRFHYHYLFAIIVKSVANLKWSLKDLAIILDFTNDFVISDRKNKVNPDGRGYR